MENIKVSVENIWKFFLENRKQLSKEWVLIASNEEENTEVFITEENQFPKFSVEIGEKTELIEETISKVDAEESYKTILNLYIVEESFSSINDFDDDEPPIRLDDLIFSAKDFLSEMIDEPIETYFSDEDCVSFLAVVEGFLNEYGLYISLDGDSINQDNS